MDTGFNSFAITALIHQRLAGFEQFSLHHFHHDEIFAGCKLSHFAKTLALRFLHRAFSPFQLLQHELVCLVKGKRPLVLLPLVFSGFLESDKLICKN